MQIEGAGCLLRIYVGEAKHHGTVPLYQAVVELLRARGVAGASVFRGIEGYGKSARIHTTQILRLSEDLPILIEVIDSEERIRSVLPELDAMIGDGLITLEKVEIFAYRATALQDGAR